MDLGTLQLIDAHVHFFPPRVFEAIWEFFESKSHGLWPIHYRLHGREHVEQLRRHNVSRFTSLVYAHKPGMADSLNEFVLESSRLYPQIIPCGTVFAADGDTARTARRLFEEYGFHGIKLHPFVSGEDLDDPRFFPCYEVMAALNKVLICHPGSGPVYTRTDGAHRVRAVLERFPTLKIVVAHCGAVEYREYEQLATEFESVYFDTAMNCVQHRVFPNSCPGREFFLKFQDRILFGSDYPNIPYDYQEQVTSLRRLQLGTPVENKVFAANAARLLGIPDEQE